MRVPFDTNVIIDAAVPARTSHEVDPRSLFETLEAVFDFTRMNRAALRVALGADPEADFEDVYLAAAGKEAGAEIVVTRNEQDFTSGPLTPYGPETLKSMIRGVIRAFLLSGSYRRTDD